MDNFVLTMAIRWLADVDVFAASCVSSEWQQALSAEGDNEALWKQVCKNSYPQVFANLQNDDGMNYRRLTLGLWRGVIPQEPAAIILTLQHSTRASLCRGRTLPNAHSPRRQQTEKECHQFMGDSYYISIVYC